MGNDTLRDALPYRTRQESSVTNSLTMRSSEQRLAAGCFCTPSLLSPASVAELGGVRPPNSKFNSQGTFSRSVRAGLVPTVRPAGARGPSPANARQRAARPRRASSSPVPNDNRCDYTFPIQRPTSRILPSRRIRPCCPGVLRARVAQSVLSRCAWAADRCSLGSPDCATALLCTFFPVTSGEPLHAGHGVPSHAAHRRVAARHRFLPLSDSP